MDTLSSAVEARVFERVKRSGYDPEQVDRFMARIAGEALSLERQVTAAHAKIRGLERHLAGTKETDEAVGAAFLAAADAKDRILGNAERRARSIVERAEAEAADLAFPRRELETRQQQVDELLARAEQARGRADEEAERLLSAARTQAERIVAEARRDALAAIEESKREAEDWIQQVRAEHTRVALMLRGLKAAVREMLDDAAEHNEAINVILAEETREHPERVQLPG